MSEHETELFDGEADDEAVEFLEAEADVLVSDFSEADAEVLEDEPGEETADASEDGPRYAGKFKSAEDLERAYQAVQAKLGEQGRELGAYRQWFEQQQAEQPEPGDGVFDWAEEEPAYTPDPEAVYAAAAADYVSLRPDFEELRPMMDQIVAEEPHLRLALNAGPAAQRLQTLDAVYRQAAHRRTAIVSELNQRIAVEQAIAANQAASEASVVTTTTAKPPAPPPSAADRIGAEWQEIEDSYASGWRIGK